MSFDVLTAGLLSQIDHYIQSAQQYRPFAKTAQNNDRLVRDIWFDPAANQVIIRKEYGPESDTGLYKVASVETDIPPHWCGLALSCGLPYFQEAHQLADQMMGFPKTAESPTMAQKVKSMLGWDDRYYPTNPVAAMLATGVLGAGLGYGGASLASQFLPDSWDKKKFRRTGTMLGGAIGAAPGALEVFKSLLIGQPVLDGSHMRLQKESAFFGSDGLPSGPQPLISGEDLIKMTWQHPLVSSQMTPGQQALMTGAVHGATAISGSPFFTPRDMGRLTAGLGSGYACGLVAGKVLGTLTGMPPSAQNTLANAGMYAGALKAVLPIIYGQ